MLMSSDWEFETCSACGPLVPLDAIVSVFPCLCLDLEVQLGPKDQYRERVEHGSKVPLTLAKSKLLVTRNPTKELRTLLLL